ncbi:MAG: hypothetical protein ACK4RZ_04760 [Paracoccaceae bacterium]
MTALITATRFEKTDTGLALQRARAASIDYCTVAVSDLQHPLLRDLPPIEAMYAYFGADEA